MLLFALAFTAVAYFVPRFLRYSGDPTYRLVIVIAAAVIVLINVWRRQQRRKRVKASARLDLKTRS